LEKGMIGKRGMVERRTWLEGEHDREEDIIRRRAYSCKEEKVGRRHGWKEGIIWRRAHSEVRL
jgi:hypothetical protein